MTAPTHVLYIDDSGTKEYCPPGKSYAANNSQIAEKFRQGPGGRIQGYGVVKFPL